MNFTARILASVSCFAASLAFARIAAADIDAGLILHWNFDDCSAAAGSGTSADGTIHGAPTCVPGVSGQALLLNGSTDYVTANDAGIGNLGNDATMAVWIKADPTVDDCRIFEKDKFSYWIFGCNTARLFFSFNQFPPYDESRIQSKSIAEVAGRWTLLVVVKTGTTYTVYVNGIFATSMETNEATISNDTVVTLGRSQYFQTAYFKGAVDDARIYDRALSAAEVAELNCIGGGASGGPVLTENFEDQLLDTRITSSLTNIPAFPPTTRGAGIKSTTSLAGSFAYGFGRSSCPASCFDNYRSRLTADFGTPTAIGSVRLKYRELFGDWGTWLSVAVDGVSISGTGPTSCGSPCFDGPPGFNTHGADASVSEVTFPVDRLATTISITVTDITNESEMFLDDLVIESAGSCLAPVCSEQSCDDGNVCTSDTCTGQRCVSTPIGGCPLVPVDQESGDEFGAATAITADFLVVGAPASVRGTGGSAHVFRNTEQGYEEVVQAAPVAVPFVDPEDGGGRFGAAVDVDGNTVVVASPADDVVATADESKGDVFVFFFDGTVWLHQATLSDTSGLCGEFGADVAISGDTIAVGAPGGDCTQVFERSGSQWSLATTLHPDAAGERFGQAVDISGDTILVGAPGTGETCSTDAKVYAFRNLSSWTLEDVVHDPLESGSGCYGYAVAIDGANAVVGAPQDDTTTVGTGAAYIITRDQNGWSNTEQLAASPGLSPIVDFGSSVAIAADDVVVGAPGVAAYLFHAESAQGGIERAFPSAGKWPFRRSFLPPPESRATSSKFGFSVSVTPGSAAIGAPGEDVEGLTDTGAVYRGKASLCGDDAISPGEECDDGDSVWRKGERCNQNCSAVDCGDPDDSGKVTTADALFTLHAVVGNSVCDLAICDSNHSGGLTTTDALLVLRKAVGQAVELTCE